MDDKRLLASQQKVIKEWFNKSGPVSYDTATTIAAAAGFRMIPKFINNRLEAKPDKYRLADWVGLWTTSASGLITLSYGGTTALKYWLVFQVAGNLIGTIMYSVS